MAFGEGTGVMIAGANHPEAAGNGVVVIVDRRDIKHSNITQVKMGELISEENSSVNILVRENVYLLKQSLLGRLGTNNQIDLEAA